MLYFMYIVNSCIFHVAPSEVCNVEICFPIEEIDAKRKFKKKPYFILPSQSLTIMGEPSLNLQWLSQQIYQRK